MKSMVSAVAVFLILGGATLGQEATSVSQSFEIAAVGPDGKPAAGVKVEVRISPTGQERSIEIGELVSQTKAQLFVKANAQGVIRLGLPPKVARVTVLVQSPGYGPCYFAWQPNARQPNARQPLPAKHTIRLDFGISIGSVVTDESGRPIADAMVRPSIRFKGARLHVGTRLKTDANGRWVYQSVPSHMKSVAIQVSHAHFQPMSRTLSVSEFGVEPAAKPEKLIRLNRGLVVSGTVIGPDGKPVKDALVRTKFLNDVRQGKTDANGRYSIFGCQERNTQVVVSAKGLAIEAKKVSITPEMAPVDFTLEVGGHVRIRVIDGQGNPVARARIFFQRWRDDYAYFAFDLVNQYTDKNGVWEWNEAPTDSFTADISRRGAMQLSERLITPRDEVYVFSPPPPLVISGSVLDDETGKPIPKFRVTPGILSKEGHLNWIDREATEGADGKFELKRYREHHRHLVRIDTLGYQATPSREIKSDEGRARLRIRLKPSADASGRIITPDNKPAAGAEIVLAVKGSQVAIENGRFDYSSTYQTTKQTASKLGAFRLPMPVEEFRLIALHDAGYAIVKPELDASVGIIKLTPWAKVKGTFRVGDNAKSSVGLRLNLGSKLLSGAGIYQRFETTTDANGQYTFDRAFAGEGSIGRNFILTVNDGAVDRGSARREPLKTEAGKTTTADVGGTGRAVIGKLIAPKGSDPTSVVWKHAYLSVSRVGGDNAPTAGRNALRFLVAIGRDGRFRIDDVPPGKYQIRISQAGPGGIPGRLPVEPTTVPDGDRTTVVDLGTIELQLR